MRCLDTNEDVEQRESARTALVASLKQFVGLEGDSADRVVNSLFVRQHPDGRYAKTTILDAGMLRVAAALFDHQETASRLATFIKLGVEERLTELLKLREQIAALEPDPSPEQSLAQTNVATSSADLAKLKHAFSVLLLAHLRLVRTISKEKPEMLRAGLRVADAGTIGPLLAQLKPYADTIYGPAAGKRDFTALATDLATVRMPEEFIRDSQIKTANISEDITGDRSLMDALENLACYMVARDWTDEMRKGLLKNGELNLSNGKPMGIRDDEHAKDILRSIVSRVNEIACGEYDMHLVPLLFEPRDRSTSKDEVGGEYSLETRDIYLNFDRVLRQELGGTPRLIGTLVHEITHAYQHALALGTTKHRVPPGVRDAGAIFDFNAANYAPAAVVALYPYRRQPMERHAHYVGYTVQRNLELALRARGAKRGLGDPLSEDRMMIVSAWTLSSTEPNPINPLESERDAMSRGAIFPRQPDTIPPWQRSANQPPSGQVTDEDDSS